MKTYTEFTARRAVPEVRIWPADRVRVADDGTIEVVRRLPPIALGAIRRAEARGDVRPVDAVRVTP